MAAHLFLAAGSGDATWRAVNIQLFKNQNQLGTTSSTTHRLMLEVPATSQRGSYIGRVRLVTNQRGGPKGDAGATGPRGLAGEDGEVGATGPRGATGSAGPQGVPGNTGSKGRQG